MTNTMTLTAVAGAKAARLEAATIGRSVKLLDLVRQLAPLLRQIEIHQSRFQRDREAAGPFTVLRSTAIELRTAL